VIKNGGKTIEGKTVSGADGADENDDDDAKFKIDLIDTEESSEETVVRSLLQDGSKFNGASFINNKFTMKITSRNGNDFQGTILWEENKNETKFQGRIDDKSKIHIEEISDNISQPSSTIYQGLLSSNNASIISGNCLETASNLTRRFYINLS